MQSAVACASISEADAFHGALEPRMEHFVDEEMWHTLYPLGSKAGGLTEEADIAPIKSQA